MVIASLDDVHGLFARLLYGTGMRLLECAQQPWVKDMDFGRREITMRQGKGGKDRIAMLPLLLF